MYSEITREAFRALVSTDTKVSRVDNKELAVQTYYVVHGVTVQAVVNYISETEQYYIQDINS